MHMYRMRSLFDRITEMPTTLFQYQQKETSTSRYSVFRSSLLDRFVYFEFTILFDDHRTGLLQRHDHFTQLVRVGFPVR